jgi:LPXTG-motif cell wall-anchored protein
MKTKEKYLIKFLTIAFMLFFMLPSAALAYEGGIADVSTVEEFVDAVSDESVTTINIIRDVDLSSAGIVDVSGLTINLNGNKVYADNFTLIFEGTDFIIKNGTFIANNNGSYALFIGDGETSQVVIENITTIGGINVFNSSNVTLRNVNVTGTNYYAIWCDEGGQVTVESGTFQTNGVAVLGLTTEGSILNIEGGSFQTNGKPLVLVNGNTYGKPVITGGNFDIPVSSEYFGSGFDLTDDGNGNYTVSCTHVNTEERNRKDANCTEKGYSGDVYCLNCGKIIQSGTEINALGHDMVYHAAVKETCTEAGILEYWHCSRCNKNFSDSMGTTELTDVQGNSAVGHIFSEWTTDENFHWKKCTYVGCETVVSDSKTSHVDGDGDGNCDICGYQMVTVADKNSQVSVSFLSVSPRTGDESNSVLWVILMIAAGAAIVGMIFFGKRKIGKK